MDYKKMIASLIVADGFSTDDIEAMIVVPKEFANGDYALPCFRFSKAMKKSPAAIADEFSKLFLGQDFLARTESVNGYLNFYLNRDRFNADVLSDVLSAADRFGASDEGRGRVICIDYSSVNVAKPFHMGHLSTTVIGAALYRIFNFLGYKAVGINHLGDWGTQFGKLIVAYKKWGDRKDIETRGIASLLQLYIKFHKEADADESLNDQARLWFKKIEENDAEATEIFSWFKAITLKEVQKTYQRLGVAFDSYAGESFYNDKMQPVIDELKQKGLLKESEGAQVVDLEEYKMPPCLIVKADGATLYATRDIAAAFYRKKTYDFYKCLYVVAYQQNLHFKQWFKVVELMGYDWAADLEHIAFGMVSMEDGAMSTREGKVILLEDVLNRATERAAEILAEKSPDLENAADVAEKIGVGAVVFSALQNGRIKDIVFSYDRVLNFEGETGPYLQYTHARCTSVLKKGGDIGTPDFAALDNEQCNALINLLSLFPRVIADAAQKREPSLITRHIIDVAQAYNKFYFDFRILDAAEGERNARLLLTAATRQVIKNGLSLLGLAAPDKM